MSHERVLIVEDEENERSGLGEIVSSWGFRVETARDGLEGLEKATQWSPAIVVTDMKMPRSEEHTSELQSPDHLVCRLLLEKKKKSYEKTCTHRVPPDQQKRAIDIFNH